MQFCIIMESTEVERNQCCRLSALCNLKVQSQYAGRTRNAVPSTNPTALFGLLLLTSIFDVHLNGSV
jgi:hypothetical protein